MEQLQPQGYNIGGKMVASNSGKHPHFIVKCGSVSCDSIYPNCNICSNAVAVAKTNNCLH